MAKIIIYLIALIDETTLRLYLPLHYNGKLVFHENLKDAERYFQNRRDGQIYFNMKLAMEFEHIRAALKIASEFDAKLEHMEHTKNKLSIQFKFPSSAVVNGFKFKINKIY